MTDSDSHDRFPCGLSGQVVDQLGSEFGPVDRFVEPRVVVHFSSGDLWKDGQCGDVGVLVREEEHIHGDLRAAQVQGHLLVETVRWIGLQQRSLHVRSQKLRVVAVLQGTLHIQVQENTYSISNSRRSTRKENPTYQNIQSK